MATKTVPSGKTAQSSEAHEQVRRYLQWLHDPESLVDPALVEKLDKQAQAASDPLEQLRLQAELHRARSVDADQIRSGFHRFASQLAADEHIPVEAFVALGVPLEDLQQAGLAKASTRRRARSGRAATPGRVSSSRSGRKGVLQAVAGLGDEFFTIGQLQELTGASQVTIRKTIEELIEGGKVGEFDPDEAYAGRGRAPKRYRMLK